MNHCRIKPLLFFSFLCAVCLASYRSQAQPPDSGWAYLSARLAALEPSWTSVPGHIVDSKLTTGMLLGNGDIGIVCGDSTARQTFRFGKSDFWGVAVKKPDADSSIWQGSILSAGGLTISAAGGSADAGRVFRMKQDMARGEVVTTMRLGNAVVHMTSWTADSTAERNYFISRLTADTDIPLHVDLWVPETYKYGGRWLDCSAIYPYRSGTGRSALWVSRQNYNGSHFNHGGDYLARIALAATLAGGAFTHVQNLGGKSSGDFILHAHRPVYLVVAFRSGEGTGPAGCPAVSKLQKEAVGDATSLRTEDIAGLKRQHEDWWKRYWLRSYVNLHDSVFGRFYYGSLYVLGCASREKAGGRLSFPPSLFGNWITTDLSSWGARYFLNYNEEAAYYGACSSNRPALEWPYINLILHEAAWQENATHRAGYPGICHQRSLTPFHLVQPSPAIVPVASEQNYRKLPADQKSNGAFAAMPLIWYYEYTGDTAYLRRSLYPYLKKLEAFYDAYMDKSSRPYHIRHSSAHEGSVDLDPNLDIGFCRRLCRTLIGASKVLGKDAGLRGIWEDDLKNLAPYPITVWNGEKVYAESATKRGSTDPAKLFHPGDQPINLEGAVFPGEDIYLGGDPAELTMARRSLKEVGGWCVNQGGSGHNGFPKVWPVAARIGWPAGDLYQKFRKAIIAHSRPSNMTTFQGGGGIETAGAIEGVNSMLMQSEGHLIRLFPDWPKDRDASFVRLRAKGAFLVSAVLKDGQVGQVRLTSEKGGPVTLANPWEGRKVKVARLSPRATKAVDHKQENGDITFETRPGGHYVIGLQGRFHR
jgi:hypothetical protein